MSGKYVVFEGCKGSGKSTIAKMFFDALPSSRKKMFTAFPSHTGPIGSLLREALEGRRLISRKSYLFLMVADGLDWETSVRGKVGAGGVFVADRHPMFSSRVYQFPDHEPEHIENIHEAAQWRKPDMAFLLDVPAEVAISRRKSREKYRDAVFEQDEFEENHRLRERYLSVFKAYEGTRMILDAMQTPETLVQTALLHTGLM